jgi:hypothetical protein
MNTLGDGVVQKKVVWRHTTGRGARQEDRSGWTGGRSKISGHRHRVGPLSRTHSRSHLKGSLSAGGTCPAASRRNWSSFMVQ